MKHFVIKASDDGDADKIREILTGAGINFDETDCVSIWFIKEPKRAAPVLFRRENAE